MKKKILLIIAVFLWVSNLNAQKYTEKQRERVADRIEKYDELLLLTDQQYLEIQALMLQQTVLTEALNGWSPDEENWLRIEIEILKKGDEIDSLLTEEQREQRQRAINKLFVNNKTGKSLGEEGVQKPYSTMDSIVIDGDEVIIDSSMEIYEQDSIPIDSDNDSI